MNTQKKTLLAGASAALLSFGSPSFAVIDFETTDSSDNDEIDVRHPRDDHHGVTVFFGLDPNGLEGGIERTEPIFREAVGGSDDLNGFKVDQTGDYDVEGPTFVPGSGSGGGLGGFFARADPVPNSSGGSWGGDALFVIEYTAGASTSASGQIWDIDGDSSSETEQFSVVAYDSSLTAMATETSPLGTSNGAGSLDGLPWLFQFDNLASPIKFITIDFIGSKSSNIDIAFDNFNASAVVVPEPSIYAILFGIGALALVTLRRRR